MSIHTPMPINSRLTSTPTRLASCLDLAEPVAYELPDVRRMRVSTQPFAPSDASDVTHSFSTQAEYTALITKLQDALPPLANGARRTKYQVAHLELISLLQERIQAIEAWEKVRS